MISLRLTLLIVAPERLNFLRLKKKVFIGFEG